MRNFRFQKTAKFLLIAAIAAVFFFHLTRHIRDNDFFWHLKTGQWAWEHKQIPVKDPFSFTTEGLQSVNEHFIMSSYWLSQLALWLFYRAGGMPGIVLLRFLIVGILIFVMIKKKEGDSTLYTGLLLLFLCLLLNSYPIERPQVFSFLFFALLLHLLKGRVGNGVPDQAGTRYGRTLYVSVPLLMLVWANMHGGYLAGVAAIALYLALEGLKFASPALRPMKKRDYQALAIAGLSGLFISFINPNAYHVFLNDFVFLPDYNNIEYQSTIRIFRRFHDYSIIVYWFMLSLAAAGLLLTIKKIDITEAVLLAFLGYFSFNAVRYVAFFMIAALPVAGRIFSEGKLRKPARALVLAGSLFTSVFFTWDHVNFDNLLSGRWVDEHKFPVAAADFIQTHDLKGNMYNYLDWGGYLIWRLAPERKVFIDGRTLYSHTYLLSELIDNAGESRGVGMSDWKTTLEAYNIQYTVTPPSLPLVRALSHDSKWVPVFYDNNSVIFVRDTSENRHVTEKYGKAKGPFPR